jgi:hypothetical protein
MTQRISLKNKKKKVITKISQFYKIPPNKILTIHFKQYKKIPNQTITKD